MAPRKKNKTQKEANALSNNDNNKDNELTNYSTLIF